MAPPALSGIAWMSTSIAERQRQPNTERGETAAREASSPRRYGTVRPFGYTATFAGQESDSTADAGCNRHAEALNSRQVCTNASARGIAGISAEMVAGPFKPTCGECGLDKPSSSVGFQSPCFTIRHMQCCKSVREHIYEHHTCAAIFSWRRKALFREYPPKESLSHSYMAGGRTTHFFTTFAIANTRTCPRYTLALQHDILHTIHEAKDAQKHKRPGVTASDCAQFICQECSNKPTNNLTKHHETLYDLEAVHVPK